MWTIHGVAAVSGHRRASCPPDEVVGGLFFDFELIRTRFECRAPHAIDATMYPHSYGRAACRGDIAELVKSALVVSTGRPVAYAQINQ